MTSSRLSPPELDVLAGAARGETVADTAARTGTPVGTVKQLRRLVLAKLDAAENMTVAVHRAHELGLLGQRPDPSALPLTDGQRRAFHAKCSDLDNLHQAERRTTKLKTFAEASRLFGREITSANDLTRAEADVILELLEQRLVTGEQCSFVSAASVRCRLAAGHSGGHEPIPADWVSVDVTLDGRAIAESLA